MTMLSTVFFDLDNTLFDRDAAFRASAQALLNERLPGHGASAETVMACAPMAANRREFAARLASAFPPLAGTRFVDDLYAAFLGSIVPDEAVLALVRDISARFRTGIITNGSRQVQRAKLARLGLDRCVGASFVSGEVGIAKPHPGIFAQARAWAGCAPAECLMVGDDPVNDIAGAAQEGWRTCWVSHGQTYPPGLPVPDLTVTTVMELREVLP